MTENNVAVAGKPFEQFLTVNDAEIRFCEVYSNIENIRSENYDHRAWTESRLDSHKREIDMLTANFNYMTSMLNDLLFALNEAKENERWNLTDVDTTVLDEYLHSIPIIGRG